MREKYRFLGSGTVGQLHTHPNLIGSVNHSYIYSTGDNNWTEVRQLSGASVPLPPSFTEVRDQRLIEQLNDTRELRLERLALRDQRHPDDPYRTIAKSPFTLAEVSPDNSDVPGADTRLAQTETSPQWTTHSQHVLRALEERLPPGSALSEDRLAQLTAATKVARISESDRLDVQVADGYITIRGEHPARIAQVDLRQPVPTAAESHEIFNNAEQAQMYSAYRQAEQSQQAQQGLERA